MNVSRDSVLALQRHFLGALRTPARTWFELLPATRIGFTGSTVRRAAGGCLLDLGTVDSPGVERHTVRISHRGAGRVEVRIAGAPEWLQARWRDGRSDTAVLESGSAGVTLALTATHAADSDFRGSLQLLVTAGGAEHLEELPVQMTARRLNPVAHFDFNGSPSPRPWDFGNGDTPYELSVTSSTSIPVVVRCADLPAWMMFEVDGRRRSGPLPGRFFERSTPVTIRLRPQVLGRHDGSLHLETSDPRPQRQSIDLRFSACLQSAKPCVRAVVPSRTRVRPNQTIIAIARLENWGGVPARILRRSPLHPSVQVAESFVIPAARDGNPGTMLLGIRVVAAHLEAGAHTLPVALHVAGGEPAEVTVALPVEIGASERSPQTIAAFFVLCLIAALFLFYLAAGGTS